MRNLFRRHPPSRRPLAAASLDGPPRRRRICRHATSRRTISAAERRATNADKNEQLNAHTCCKDCELQIAELRIVSVNPQFAIRNPQSFHAHVRAVALAVACLLAGAGAARASDGAASFVDVARQVQPKVVKLYGAGGLRGLEAYQSGLLISGKGHVLTVWSYVLDADEVTVVLDDGRRFTAKHVAADPLTEIAVLKFDPGDEDVPHFDLAAAATAEPGARVLAFSNCSASPPATNR